MVAKINEASEKRKPDSAADARFAWSFEDFRERLAVDKSGYPRDYQSWPPERQKKCAADCAHYRESLAKPNGAVHSHAEWKEHGEPMLSYAEWSAFDSTEKNQFSLQEIRELAEDGDWLFSQQQDAERFTIDISSEVAEAENYRRDAEAAQRATLSGKTFLTDAVRSEARGERAGEDLPPIVLHIYNPADWEDKQAPPRLWDVPDYIPHGSVTLLYSDGGGGKGYLELQLAVARALHSEWIGLMVEPGRTLVLSTEDDFNELWRRLERILPFYNAIVPGGARMKDLADIRLVDLVGEDSVLGLLSKGIIKPTRMYEALDACLADFKPGLVILDVLADLFSGEENSRPQVTQFVGLLKRLCIKHDCTILLAAQPSLTGINTDSGTSGSTGWHNSGRSRLWVKRVKDANGNELNKDLRTFEGKKNNYGEIGGKFDIAFKGGLFRRVIGPTGFDKLAAEHRVDQAFLMLLKRLTAQNRPVRTTNSKSGAPTLFAAEPDNGGFTAKDFSAAMLRLLDKHEIENIEDGGPPSKRNYRLVIKEGTQNGTD